MAKGKIEHVEKNSPVVIDIEEGKNYFWCTCGQSSNQPFCDGSHKGGDFLPLKWMADQSGKKFFCNCKQSEQAPFCDGSHKKL